MPSFKKAIQQKIDDSGVRIYYLPGHVTKWWNDQREDPEENQIFCGWYWKLGGEEGGAYKTPSEGMRIFYYASTRRTKAPSLSEQEIKAVARKITRRRKPKKSQPYLRRVA